MTITAEVPPTVLLPVGGAWRLEVTTRNEDGYLHAGTPVASISVPDDPDPVPIVLDEIGAGRYRATYTVTAAGRHVATLSTADDSLYLTADVAMAVTAAGMPVAGDVVLYLRDNG